MIGIKHVGFWEKSGMIITLSITNKKRRWSYNQTSKRKHLGIHFNENDFNYLCKSLKSNQTAIKNITGKVWANISLELWLLIELWSEHFPVYNMFIPWIGVLPSFRYNKASLLF